MAYRRAQLQIAPDHVLMAFAYVELSLECQHIRPKSIHAQ